MEPTHVASYGVHYHEELGKIAEALRSKERPRRLMPVDVAVLLQVVHYTNWKTGKSRVSQVQLAEDLGVPASSISLSLKRLRKAYFLARGHDKVSRDRYMIPSPYMFITGKEPKRAEIRRLWKDTINDWTGD